jgi:hypothetical protein
MIVLCLISSTFGFEDLSQDMLSVILSYTMDIHSAQTILLVNNLFYFGTRDCLSHCRESVFEMYRTDFIEQLLPLFAQIEESNHDKIDIFQFFCSISTKSIDPALDPLSIFNTFKPKGLKTHPFDQQFEDLIYGLYPFIPCISTREYYYLIHLFILHLLPSTILLVDPLKPFESAILSNKFTFTHYLGYKDVLLPLMKEENLTASALVFNEIDIRGMLLIMGYWFCTIQGRKESKGLFNIFLKNMSCVLLLLKGLLTRKQVEIVDWKLTGFSLFEIV